MSKLAFFTYGVLKELPGHPTVQGFIDRAQPIFMAAMGHEGCIGLATGPHNTEPFADMLDADYKEWGPFALPRFYNGSTAMAEYRAGVTLTLWKDIDSVFQFSYTNLHADALKYRHDWIEDTGYPFYVMWWVDDDHTPTFGEACQKLEHLHDHGSSVEAFTFKQAFDASGNPTKPDASLIRGENNPKGER